MMITPFVTLNNNLDYTQSAFDCISIPKEKENQPKNIDRLDYLVTHFPRNEEIHFSFVYGLFNREKISFSDNQATIIGISNNMFVNSSSLTSDEHRIVMNAFMKSVKRSPSLPGRR